MLPSKTHLKGFVATIEVLFSVSRSRSLNHLNSQKFFFYFFLLSRGKQRRFLDKVVYELLTEFLDSRREADLFLLISLASLASFCLWAKILAYSAAAWRFFSARLRLTAKRWRFLCNMIGVTRRWTWNTTTNGINTKILQWSGERTWIKNEWN